MNLIHRLKIQWGQFKCLLGFHGRQVESGTAWHVRCTRCGEETCTYFN
jgi:hypothetical protein